MKIKNRDFVTKLGISNTLKINNSTYNHSKLLEEILELGEVLIKMTNKTIEKQPTREKLVEELGDVIFRSAVLMIKEGLEEEVEQRIERKMEQLNGYLEEGKYKGGI